LPDYVSLERKFGIGSFRNDFSPFPDDEAAGGRPVVIGFDEKENVRRVFEIGGKEEKIFLCDRKIRARMTSVNADDRGVFAGRLVSRNSRRQQKAIPV
jgi:hypothetical protein